LGQSGWRGKVVIVAGDEDVPQVAGTAGLNGDECWEQGRSLESAGRLDEAVAAYREAVRRAPRNPLSHIRLGLALRGVGRDEEANQAFQRALELSTAG
jgi:Flp pilus assembly protein TadD